MSSLISSLPPIPHLALSVAGFAVLALVANTVYTVWFHPLSKVPGPWWAAASRIPYAWNFVGKTAHKYILGLHKQYGPVVRYSPNEVSVADADVAWQEIYGFRTGKQKGLPAFNKDTNWFSPPVDGVPSMVLAPDESHGRQRKIISHAFSERAIHNQEELIQQHVDLLVSRLADTVAATDETANMAVWYNWITFDIISDLTFGESFGCLAGRQTHKYVKLLLSNATAGSLYYIMTYWPALKYVQRLFNGPIAERMEWLKFVHESVRSRIESDTARHDFMTDILGHKTAEEGKGKQGLSDQEIFANANLFMLAGTETTATVLSATTYLLLTNPHVYDKVRAEVRTAFSQPSEITIDAANKLEYTIAVLTEAMRIMPPASVGFPRKVPATGAEVAGYWLAGNCDASVSVTQLAAYHSPDNFRDPDDFVPERWLGDEKYKDDRRGAFNPFSVGPRNCLGKNLAYAEMRVIIARMVWTFDMHLADDSRDWLDRCQVSSLWLKAELNVRLTPVPREGSAS